MSGAFNELKEELISSLADYIGLTGLMLKEIIPLDVAEELKRIEALESAGWTSSYNRKRIHEITSDVLNIQELGLLIVFLVLDFSPFYLNVGVLSADTSRDSILMIVLSAQAAEARIDEILNNHFSLINHFNSQTVEYARKVKEKMVSMTGLSSCSPKEQSGLKQYAESQKKIFQTTGIYETNVSQLLVRLVSGKHHFWCRDIKKLQNKHKDKFINLLSPVLSSSVVECENDEEFLDELKYIVIFGKTWDLAKFHEVLNKPIIYDYFKCISSVEFKGKNKQDKKIWKSIISLLNFQEESQPFFDVDSELSAILSNDGGDSSKKREGSPASVAEFNTPNFFSNNNSKNNSDDCFGYSGPGC
jgi:hypothetical protein